MGLLGRKERRVPDLSRYDYHYQNKPAVDSSKYYVPRDMATKRLSASAAAAAIYTNPNPNATGVSRSYSMMHSYAPTSVANNSGRTYSLQSNRTASITSNSRRPVGSGANGNRTVVKKKSVKKQASQEFGTGVNQSRANSITVRTTKVKDPQGRTKSITRKTIRRINGYEVVETTTTTTDILPVDSVDGVPPLEMDGEAADEDVHNHQTHFDEFSGDYVEDDMSIDQHSGQPPLQQDAHIEEIVEEECDEEENEYEEPPKRMVSQKRANSLTGREATPPSAVRRAMADGETPLDQTSSISNFKDAMEYIPSQQPKSKAKPVTRTKSSLRNSTSVRQGAASANNQRRTVSFTQESTIQKKKAQQKPKQALTEQEMYLQALEVAKKKVYKTDEPALAGGAVNGSTKRVSTMGKRMTLRDTPTTAKMPRSSSMMNNFHGTGNQANQATTPKKTPEVKRTKSLTSSIGHPPKMKKKLTDEEMYEKALEIAQKRYNESVGLENVNSSGGTVVTAPVAPSNGAPKKSSFKDRFVKTFQHEDKPAAGVETTEGLAAAPVVTPMEEQVIIEEQPAVIAQEENITTTAAANGAPAVTQTTTTTVPMVKTTSHPVSGMNASIGVGSNASSGARKFSNAQYSADQYASYGAVENKSKNKFVNKILKFAQQNSGYRPQTTEEEEAALAAASVTPPVNVVPVQRRTSVTKPHGAATTLPVESALPDDTSVSSFRHTHEKVERPLTLDAIEKNISNRSGQENIISPPVVPIAATESVEPVTPEATKIPTAENVDLADHVAAAPIGTAPAAYASAGTRSGVKTPFIDIDAVDARSGHIPFDESQIPEVGRVASSTSKARTASTSTATTEKKKQSFLKKLFRRK